MAIKVQAVDNGEYNGHFQPKGSVFFLVDIKHPETKEVLRTAEECFSDYRETVTEEKTPEGKLVKVRRRGWMKKVVAEEGVLTPAQLKSKQAAEEAEAQEKADAEALTRAQHAGQADATEQGNLTPNAAGTELIKKPKAQGAGAKSSSLNAGDNAKSQSASNVL